MKKLNLLFIISISLLLFSCDCDTDENHPKSRTITVTGSAAMTVIPDEIVISVTLEEYWPAQFTSNVDPKDYNNKVSMKKIEAGFFKTLADLEIPQDSIILDQTGRRWQYKGKSNLYKSYRIIVATFDKADSLIAAMDEYGVSNIRISEVRNKNLTEYRAQVKAQAIRAALGKASALLKAIDERPGKVISINENNYESLGSQWPGSSNNVSMISNTFMGSSGNSNNEDTFRKIPLRFEVTAVFEIK